MNQTLIISGAGPTGLFCALKLAQNGINTVVLDPILSKHKPWSNNRTIALSYGSIQLLKQAGVDITSLLDVQINKIEHVHISIQGKWGACNMHARDYDVDALGYVISYSKLCQALYKTCLANHNICFSAKKLLSHAYNEKTGLVDGCVEGNITYSAPLIIVSEGSKIQQQYALYSSKKFNAGTHQSCFNQYAHVGWVSLPNISEKYKNTAFERFTNQGPLALLPYKYSDDEGQTYNYAIVWCSFNADSQLCNADKLQDILGWKLGKVQKLKIEQHFNLSPQTRNILHQNQIVYIGNSAQSLHPVAGQGLNLGFRQAYILADNIMNKYDLPTFVTRIQNDRLSMLCTTSIMSNIFTMPIPCLKQNLGCMLQVVDIIPAIKKKFAEHFMYGLRA